MASRLSYRGCSNEAVAGTSSTQLRVRDSPPRPPVSYTQPRNSRWWVFRNPCGSKLAPFKIGVSVLCPGPVNTKIISNTNETRPSSSATVEETKISEAAITQAKAFLAAGADPDEVGEMVLAAGKGRSPLYPYRSNRGGTDRGAGQSPARCNTTDEITTRFERFSLPA